MHICPKGGLMLSRFLAVGTVLAVLVNVYLYRSLQATGVALFILLVSLLLTFGYGIKKQKEIVLFLASIVVFGSLVVLRAATLPKLMLLGGMYTSLIIFWYLTVIQSKFLRSLAELFLVPFRLAGSYISAGINALGKAIHFSKATHKEASNPVQEWLPSILMGGFAGIPIVGVLLMLLSSADPIFNKTLQQLFSSFTISELGVRLLISIATFLFTLPLAFMRIKNDFVSPVHKLIPVSAIKPITVIMSMIALTIGLFLIIQWPYVFAHVAQEQNLSTFGVATYSEYVKKGFGEFLVTAVFIYSVVWIGLLAHRNTFNKRNTILFLVQTSVIILFFTFLLSIGRRIFLYWEFHGLSVIRLYGSLFLLWIGFLTTTLYLRHFFQWKWIQIEVIGTFILLTTIGLINAEHFIVTHHPPTVNGTVDSVYLSRLSADGYHGWKQAFTQSIATIREMHSKTGILNEDDRRKIAYAGITLGVLNRNYYNLTNYYGSNTDKQLFAEKMMILLNHEIEETTRLFSESLEQLQQKGDEATISAQSYITDSSQSRSYELIQYVEGLKSMASQSALLQDQSNEQDLFFRIQPRSPYTLGEFHSSLCHQTFYYKTQTHASSCIPNFYSLIEKKRPYDFLDTVFRWNIQEHFVYKQITQDIPLDTLIEAEQNYTTLWKRILRQPKDQQSYQLDISYDAPFVAPLW